MTLHNANKAIDNRLSKARHEFNTLIQDDVDFSDMYTDDDMGFKAWLDDYAVLEEYIEMTLHDNISWCVSRLVDNYEWQGIIEYDDWLRLQSLLAEALCADSKLAEHIVNVCLTEGIIEE